MQSINLLYRGTNIKGYSWHTAVGLYEAMKRNNLIHYAFDVMRPERELDYDKLLERPILAMKGYDTTCHSIVDYVWGKQFIASIEPETIETHLGVEDRYNQFDGTARNYARKFSHVFTMSSKDQMDYYGKNPKDVSLYKSFVDCEVFKNYEEPTIEGLGFVGSPRERELFLSKIPNLIQEQSPVQKTALESAVHLAKTMNKYRFLLCTPGKVFRLIPGRAFEIMACQRVCFCHITKEIKSEYDIGYLKDGVNIVFFESFDELMDKYQYYKNKPSISEQLARNARETALEYHSIDMWVKKIVEFINEKTLCKV